MSETRQKIFPDIDHSLLAYVMRQRKFEVGQIWGRNLGFRYLWLNIRPGKNTKNLTLRNYYFSLNRRVTIFCWKFTYQEFYCTYVTARYNNLVLFLGYFCIVSEICTTVWFLCLRLRQQRIERAMELTDSFTWEDLPTRDADTGHLTAAGWIPRILKFTGRAGTVLTLLHFVQSTIRLVTNHETMFSVWYPFDWTISPFYELVYISQVTISLYQRRQFTSKLFLYCSQFNILTYPIPFLLSFLYFTTLSVYQTA